MIAFLNRAEPAVKICGVTTATQASEIADLGTSAIGVNFWPRSKRYLPPADRAWLRDPHPVPIVGVFVNASREEIGKLHGEGRIDIAQLHGDETSEFCEALAADGIPLIKAIGVADEGSLADLDRYHTPHMLLDAYQPGEYGGGGKTFNWELARAAVVRYPDLRILLSGGLDPDNGRAALDATGAAGIDLASGVEASPGVKDLEKCRALLESVRA